LKIAYATLLCVATSPFEPSRILSGVRAVDREYFKRQAFLSSASYLSLLQGTDAFKVA
jgi:hypothetical protein